MQNTDTGIPTGKYIARIDEQRCIGCTLCIKACPFDAIVGAPRHVHTVINRNCTGCKLCLSPCPVNCIELETNTRYQLICQTLSPSKQRKLKEKFAVFSRENKKRRMHRIGRIQKEKQELFERRKKEISTNKQTLIQNNEQGKMHGNISSPEEGKSPP